MALSLPISASNRAIARKFASQQIDRAKSRQVYLNTLAVILVNHYMDMIGISTNLTHSDSWNPFLRIMGNASDLLLDGNIGKLECCPILPNQSSYLFTTQDIDEDIEAVIGTVIVGLEESLIEGKLLGFLPKVTEKEAIDLNALQPLEDLCDRISERHQSISMNNAISKPTIRISEWLSDIFDSGWQEVKLLLGENQMQYAFRSLQFQTKTNSSLTIRRAKLFNFGIQLSVILVLEISPLNDSNGCGDRHETIIVAQIHPENSSLLPPDLILSILDDQGNSFAQVTTRNNDNLIQYRFSGELAERFTLRITYKDEEFEEKFEI